jgi:hypothetical protein
MGRKMSVVILVLAVGSLLAACGDDDAPTSGTVTIEATLTMFPPGPLGGDFVVAEGSDVLGCSAGTFEDMEPVGDVNRVMTCTDPVAGTFTIAFDPGGSETGPGEVNGPWSIADAGDFPGLQGGGDWWAIGDGSETHTGEISFDS